MKKFVLFMFTLCVLSLSASAQRYALIDMEYILQNVPAYESANSEIEQLSKQWQAEVEKVSKEAKSLYESRQQNCVVNISGKKVSWQRNSRN